MPSLSSGGAVAGSIQNVPRTQESPTRGKITSSSSSLETKRTPLRSKSTLASPRKRRQNKSQEIPDVAQGDYQEQSIEERVVDPDTQDRAKVEGAGKQTIEEPSAEHFGGGAVVPESESHAQEVAAERRESEERRRSSSLFSDTGDPRRVSDSSTFSIPAAPPLRKSKSSSSPGADSHYSRRSSSLFNELYGLPRLSDLGAQPDDPARKSSSIGSASLFSHGSRPSHGNESDRRSSSLFSGQGYQSDRRSSSLFSVQMSGDEGGEGRGAVPEPALAKTSALSSQTIERSPATPASIDDAQNVTVVPAREKRKQEFSPGTSPPYTRPKRSTSSSSSLKQSETLFATPSAPAPAAGRTSSEGKTSSSSLAQSASLFTSPEQPAVQESSKSKSTDSSLAAEIMLRKTQVPTEGSEGKLITFSASEYIAGPEVFVQGF